MDLEEKRGFVVNLALRMYGIPYRWGGDDPIAGLDCSGLIVELLQSVGILVIGGDWTAQALWERFRDRVVSKPNGGCLVFWESVSGYVRHVELCLDGELSIGASGGGSATNTLEDAVRQNAYVKIRPIQGRGKIKGYVDPFKIT